MRDYFGNNRSFVDLIPSNLRNQTNTAVLENLFDRFLTKDESVPLYGVIGTPNHDLGITKIQQPSAEREVNEIIPTYVFTHGAKTEYFTPTDFSSKMTQYGVADAADWMAIQSNNFAPPISIDKFVNFYNYYWVETQFNTKNSWNLEKKPEYYVIAKPNTTSHVKLNVIAATTEPIALTGSGFYDLTFEIVFNTSSNFTITAIGDTFGMVDGNSRTFDLVTPTSTNIDLLEDHFNFIDGGKTLLAFSVVRELIREDTDYYQTFSPGDKFTITTKFMNSMYFVEFDGTTSDIRRGGVTSIRTLNQFQSIDGIEVAVGDRVLVKNGHEQGIYVVSTGAWARAEDSLLENGVEIFVRNGVYNGGKLLSLQNNVWSVVGTTTNTSLWQENNFWVHKDALDGFDRSKVTQATRPIIEYWDGLDYDKTQQKFRFNQIPLFNLFHYDGTETGIKSSLFYYVEDPEGDIDVELQRRVKLVNSADFVFSHGATSATGELLFFKHESQLKTVWHPGNTSSEVAGIVSHVKNSGPSISFALRKEVKQQIITLTAVSQTSFVMKSSKYHNMDATLVVGSPFTNEFFDILIPYNQNGYSVGDVILVAIAAPDTANKVTMLNGKLLSNVDGSGELKTHNAYLINPLNQTNGELREGALYSHFGSVLQNQIGDGIDYRFGGSIKTWGGKLSLLSSLLMQKDFTIPSVIDYAKNSYETALNTFTDVFITKIFDLIRNTTHLSSGVDVHSVVDSILDVMAHDYHGVIFTDSTSGVPAFPISLAKMGIVRAVEPAVTFDNELNVNLIQHHDGHFTPAYTDEVISSLLFDKRVMAVYGDLISEYTNTMPTPVKGGVWRYIDSGINKFKIFCVDFDGPNTPYSDSLVDGMVWFNTGLEKIFKYHAVVNKWVQTNEPPIAYWFDINFSILINSCIVAVETRLYNDVDRIKVPAIDVESWDSLGYASTLEGELSSWAFSNKVDPTASNYIAANAFTWNYSRAIRANFNCQLFGDEIPARWFDLIEAHHKTLNGVIPTSRPDVFPWKLLGFQVKPTWWDTKYASKVQYINPSEIITATCAEYSPQAITFGVRVIDGVMVVAGDRVVITNNSVASRNGIWSVSDTEWTKLPIPNGAAVEVVNGQTLKGSLWCEKDGIFTQVRMWSNKMWADIINQRPTLKLSVSPMMDQLLPPYVNPSLAVAQYALTNVVPSGTSMPYIFGQKSPVETLWMKSIDFNYAIVSALFKSNPLEFLDKCWGIEYISKNGLELDTHTGTMFNVQQSIEHGTTVATTDRSQNLTFTSLNSVDGATITLKNVGAYDNSQVFLLAVDGVQYGYIREGVKFSGTVGGVEFIGLKIEDNGVFFKHADTFSIELAANNTGILVKYIPAQFNIVNGFGQLMSQMLRHRNIDGGIGYFNAAFRTWEPHIGYRVGGFVTDDLDVYTTTEKLDSNAISLVSKRSCDVRTSEINALRISIVTPGATAKQKNKVYTPTNNASDWIFRIDGFNTNTLTLKSKTFRKAGEYNTFNALEKRHTDIDWKQYTEVAGSITMTLPIIVVGLQNVINIVFGYEAQLIEDGWDFSMYNAENFDITTGRTNNFQLGLEKLIDGIYAGVAIGQGEILNPIVNGIWVNHSTGLLAPFNKNSVFDSKHDSAVFDLLGERIDTPDLNIVRNKQYSFIGGLVPIFSIRASIDTYEHMIIFNDYTDYTKSGLIYDPYQGIHMSTFILDGKMQASHTLRPEVGGFVLSGDKMVRNIESSIGTISKMYDSRYVFEDNTTSEHALALLGYQDNSYMTDLDISEKAKFNFWRGLVHMKGTNMSFDAFLNSNKFDDARLDEYWAFKIAEYGDNRKKAKPDLLLNAGDCQQQFTKFEINTNLESSFIKISPNDETRWGAQDDLGSVENFQTKVMLRNEFSVTQSDIGVVFTFQNAGDLVEYSSNLVMLNHTSFVATQTGQAYVQYSNVDVEKHTPVYIIDYVNNDVVASVPYWNPIIGVDNPFALLHIDYKSKNDPAKYNYSTIVDGNTVLDGARSWGANQLGKIWWDTSKLEYINYNDASKIASVADRLNMWGAISESGSIDVCEWVQSDTHPAKIAAGEVQFDGVPYNPKTYYRDRIWNIAPIAWSKAGTPNANAHPSFNGAFNSTLFFRGNGLASLDSGTFAGLGITGGMRIGAWRDDQEATMPLNEFILTGDFSKFFVREGVEFTRASTLIANMQTSIALYQGTYTDVNGVLSFVFDPTTDVVSFPNIDSAGTLTGETTYTYHMKYMINNTVSSFKLFESTSTSLAISANSVYKFNVGGTGLVLELQFSQAGTISFSDICEAIEQFFADGVQIQDAAHLRDVLFNSLTPTDVLPYPSALSNSPDDPINLANNGCGWRAWTVPSQSELDSDARFPNSIWRPYVGEYVQIHAPSMETIDDAIANGSYTLNDGTIIRRYASDWTQWVAVTDTEQVKISTGGTVVFTFGDKVDVNSLFVFKNGIRQITNSFNVLGNFVAIENTVAGDTLKVRIAGHTPSKDELEFDPDVSDDFKIQKQYKIDYDYVEVRNRLASGQSSTSTYYFWATNKTVSNKTPTNTIEEMLITGPSQYVTFVNSTGLMIYGLNYIVLEDNKYKLRLVDDRTLRDDPTGISLKDTHAEWVLIRKGQRTRVPKQLWDMIVDSMCAATIVGDPLPSNSRIEYDARNGTSSIYGFGDGQILAPANVLIATVTNTIINTRVTLEFDISKRVDFISDKILDWGNSDLWFSTVESIRANMGKIWDNAKPSQINEIVFAVIEDICVYNSSMTHLMKTSRLSAYSIKQINQISSTPTYD